MGSCGSWHGFVLAKMHVFAADTVLPVILHAAKTRIYMLSLLILRVLVEKDRFPYLCFL